MLCCRGQGHYSPRGRYLDVIELPLPASLSVGDLVHVKYVKAEARAAQSTSTDGLDDEVTRDFIELFGLIERHREDSGS